MRWLIGHCLIWSNKDSASLWRKWNCILLTLPSRIVLCFYHRAHVCCRFNSLTSSHWLTLFIIVPAARHGDGLYDSYMRTDHILKDEADTNSPSGLPPMPKHTVSIHTHTNTHAYTHSQLSPISCAGAHSVSRLPAPLRDIPLPVLCSSSSHLYPASFVPLCSGCVGWAAYLFPYLQHVTFSKFLYPSFNSIVWVRLIYCPRASKFGAPAVLGACVRETMVNWPFCFFG